MSVLTVQLNHPGAEKPFRLGHGYSKAGGLIRRDWNNDPTHHRKFLRGYGVSLEWPKHQPTEQELLFWGEWEGNTIFQPLEGRSPNGIHRPVFELEPRGHQNTDPYVFGGAFCYAICKQRGRLTKLEPGSLILFGSSYKEGFALDTLFVVGSFLTPGQVKASHRELFSQVYFETTLKQLGTAYLDPSETSTLRLYRGRTWEEDPTMFSFVPCKPYSEITGSGFKRLTLPFDALGDWRLSSNPTGIKIIGAGHRAAQVIWQTVVEQAGSQGFLLGISFDEPR